MLNRIVPFAGFAAAVLIFFQGSGCVTDPFVTDVDPVDTTSNGGSVMANPCDPDSIYFEQDVLPILLSNCSSSGCHDEITAEDGIILTSFTNLIETTDITPFDPNDSEIFERIVESDPDKRMPPPPQQRLGTDQIELIRQWIAQGAQDLSCRSDENCQPVDVSFQSEVYPIIEDHCRGCHSGPGPSGNVTLVDHASIAAIAGTGRLYGAIERLPGFAPMPQNGNKLGQCQVATIKAWIDAGMPDN